MNLRFEIFDQEAALQRHGSMPLLKKRAAELLPQCLAHAQTMRVALTEQNANLLECTARDLAFLLGELSPPSTLDLTIQIERMARAQDLLEVPFLLDQLHNELKKLKDLLSQ